MEQVTIERLGHQGDGIAAGPIFVPGTLPGETVEGEITGGVMDAPRIVTPSEMRVSPPCRHAKSCGGCQLQHARPDFVADWKQGVVRHALAAHGIETEFREIATSPEATRRRAGFSARRTKKGAQVGFHRKRSDVIVEVPDCRVVEPKLAAALPMVEALAVLGASRKGELSVLVTTSLGGLDVVVKGGKEADAQMQQALSELARAYDCARIAWGEDVVLTRRPPNQKMGRAEVAPPPGAFLQATPQGEAALLEDVRGYVEGASHVVDLFAGCGTFALPLAEAARVHAVEGEKAMTQALDHGWRHAQGLRHVTTEARDLFRNPLLPQELARFDAAVIDPPRAGAEAQVAQLCEARIPRIAFVSCNPVTFARDAAALLRAGYALDGLRVVDQFRWSTHVELVAGFSLR
ncbi:class I SAM-dependent RNA methyltransferase [Salipiger sp. PrR002]|uniref:class I SAM-dependent RNA methyltransferase n=1 Tax=Salipiger sp. PrR002 TaxID=2706489 RepID=UPI0013B72E5A|nr:class I SAM-dependent RNA methyltransferase [Salipiger sp. PrR002]NDV98219.1 class I SAM-dependent RNA methyltransferase [Salipiger sp. PrR002]NDW54931.1 class I SAM-dependent RNA methyltransferase [Salipiger sp. PrR004]